jgi:hypothetical protein
MSTPKIHAIIEAFVAELSAALAEASHGAIAQALGGNPSPVAVRAKGRGATSLKPAKRAKGGKRSADELQQLTESLLAHVKKNPGLRIEQIGAAIALTTKDLALPAKKLISEKKLRTKGQRRATTYFAK